MGGGEKTLKTKAFFILIIIYFCLTIFSQPICAFTYPKTRTERLIESLGPKPSWIFPIPVVSRAVWELKYPRQMRLADANINYRYGEVALVGLILAGIPTLVLISTLSAKKKRQDLEIKGKSELDQGKRKKVE
jgi:hypothetical protein